MQKEDERIQNRGEEFLQVFKKGAEFTQDLLRENERLRFRVLELEKHQAPGSEAAPAVGGEFDFRLGLRNSGASSAKLPPAGKVVPKPGGPR